MKPKALTLIAAVTSLGFSATLTGLALVAALASLSMGGAILRIIDLDGLLRLKLRAGGPQDLMDAAHLILQHPDRIAATREAARAYHLEDKLDVWLNDPRTRSQVEEELRARGAEGRTALTELAEILPKPSSRRKKS